MSAQAPAAVGALPVRGRRREGGWLYAGGGDVLPGKVWFIDLCVANDRWGARGGLSAPATRRTASGADKPPLAPVHCYAGPNR